MNVQTATAGQVRRVRAAIKRRRGRFSSGNEQLPDTPAKLRVGSFADSHPRMKRRADDAPQ
jgi:hypothetical protein